MRFVLVLLLCSGAAGCSSELRSSTDAGPALNDLGLTLDASRDGALPSIDASAHGDASTPTIDAGPVTNPALHTESEVCARWNADHAQNAEGTWTGTGEPTCDAGDMDAEWRARTLLRVNLMRWIAGLPPVTFEETRNQKAQECALIQTSNPSVTHDPDPTANCYSTEGAAGAMNSNIAGTSAIRAIEYYMVDPGITNSTSLGHRRWILDNSLGPFGVGSTNTESCLWVIGGTGGADYEVVMWPPAGPVPLEAFYVTSVGNGRELGLKDTGWSIQSDTIMFTDAVGTITDDGVVMPTNSRRLSSSSGVRYAFSMQPDGWDVEPGHTYHVQITGITPAIVYDVSVVACGTTIGMAL